MPTTRLKPKKGERLVRRMEGRLRTAGAKAEEKARAERPREPRHRGTVITPTPPTGAGVGGAITGAAPATTAAARFAPCSATAVVARRRRHPVRTRPRLGPGREAGRSRACPCLLRTAPPSTPSLGAVVILGRPALPLPLPRPEHPAPTVLGALLLLRGKGRTGSRTAGRRFCLFRLRRRKARRRRCCPCRSRSRAIGPPPFSRAPGLRLRLRLRLFRSRGRHLRRRSRRLCPSHRTAR